MPLKGHNWLSGPHAADDPFGKAGPQCMTASEEGSEEAVTPSNSGSGSRRRPIPTDVQPGPDSARVVCRARGVASGDVAYMNMMNLELYS